MTTTASAPQAGPISPSPFVISSLFGSTKRASGRLVLPPYLHVKAAFGELKLDLRDAVLPDEPVVLVCESLCSSVELLLPAGVTVVDHTTPLLSSHKLGQLADTRGPVIHLEGWSVCSDVKVSIGSSPDAPITWS